MFCVGRKITTQDFTVGENPAITGKALFQLASNSQPYNVMVTPTAAKHAMPAQMNNKHWLSFWLIKGIRI